LKTHTTSFFEEEISINPNHSDLTLPRRQELNYLAEIVGKFTNSMPQKWVPKKHTEINFQADCFGSEFGVDTLRNLKMFHLKDEPFRR